LSAAPSQLREETSRATEFRRVETERVEIVELMQCPLDGRQRDDGVGGAQQDALPELPVPGPEGPENPCRVPE
jgi:hypothetical protein